MRYIKTYEEYEAMINLQYKEGDYVLLNFDIIDDRPSIIITTTAKKRYIDNKVKILKVDATDIDYTYCVIFFDNKVTWVCDQEIIRRLTTEEIQQYEVEKEAKKYNL